MPETEPRREQLRETLKGTIYTFFQHSWPPFGPDTHLRIREDVFDTEAVVPGLEILDIDVQEEMMKIYVKIKSGEVSSVDNVKLIISRMLGQISERFLVIVPVHTPEALCFWFMTGGESHGHEGMVIVRKEDAPHLLD